jgi:hypothetical protein
MSEMFERLVEAAHDAANDEAGFEEYCSYDMARAAVRAVLAVMREPTEAMIFDGRDAINEHAWWGDGHLDDGAERACWQAMLDKALATGAAPD